MSSSRAAARRVLRVVAEAKTGTFMKLAEPMLARTAEQELRKDFDAAEESARGRGLSFQPAPVD